MIGSPVYTQNHNTCTYIASFGINPNRIPVNGWDATGYTSYAGNPPFGDRERPEHHPWPDRFDYQQMLEHWAADEQSRRPTT